MWTAKPSAFKSEVPELHRGLTILSLDAQVAAKLEPIEVSPSAIASMSTAIGSTCAVLINDGAALGIARSALRAQAALATDEALKAIHEFKSPALAAKWAKVSATFGRAYLSLAEAKFL